MHYYSSEKRKRQINGFYTRMRKSHVASMESIQSETDFTTLMPRGSALS